MTIVSRHGLAYPRIKGVVVGDESEKSFQARVVQLAKLRGWRVRWTKDSRGSLGGEPDLRMVRPPRYVLAELKSQHGRLSLEQAAEIALLERCPGVEMYVWRPSDWSSIQEVLR